jgi:putative acetyltransferase
VSADVPLPAPPPRDASGADDLALEAEQACDLVSEHGGEIVIAPDGRVVFMNASEHLVELAHALDPDNEDVKKRMAAIEAARAKRKAPAFALRPARAEDVAPLAAIARAIAAVPGLFTSRPEEIGEQGVATHVALAGAAGSACLVAEADGAAIALGSLAPLPPAASRHVVDLTIFVAPAWQRRGVGSALLRALIAWARGAPGVEKIELQARASNAAAIALYRTLGFVEEGRLARRVKVADGESIDDLLMALFVK